jgi:hypothetical protein
MVVLVCDRCSLESFGVEIVSFFLYTLLASETAPPFFCSLADVFWLSGNPL